MAAFKSRFLHSLVLMLLAACQSTGSGPTNPANPTLTLTPTSVNVNAGAAPITFTATVQNTNETVTWIYSGLGSISPTSGLTTSFTPPASIDNTASGSLTAILGNTGVSAVAPIAIYPVGITPPSEPPPVQPIPPTDPDPGTNNAPTADFSAQQQAGTLTLAFSGVSSTDPDGDKLSYSWNFGDGSSANTRDFLKTYTDSGSKQVSLTVTDPAGESDTETKTVVVEAAGGGSGNDGIDVEISGPSPRPAIVGAATSLQAEVEDAVGAVTYSWTQLGGPTGQATFASPDASNTEVTFAAEGAYVVRLTATDGSGKSDNDDVAFNVTPPSSNTAPEVNIEGDVGQQAMVNVPKQLVAVGTDPDGDALVYQWSVNFGNADNVQFASPNSASTAVTVSIAGTYSIRVTVSDSEGLTDLDDIDLTVN